MTRLGHALVRTYMSNTLVSMFVYIHAPPFAPLSPPSPLSMFPWYFPSYHVIIDHPRAFQAPTVICPVGSTVAFASFYEDRPSLSPLGLLPPR